MADPNDPLAVTIGAREIYDELVGVRDDVRSLAQTSAGFSEVVGDHEDRLRSLEKWKYGIPAAVLSAVGSVFVALNK